MTLVRGRAGAHRFTIGRRRSATILRRAVTLGVLAIVSIAATLMVTAAAASAQDPGTATATARAVDDSVDARGGITSFDYDGVAKSQRGFTATTAEDLMRADDINERLAAAADEGPPQGMLDRCLRHEDAGEVGGHVLFRHFWCQRNTVHGEYYFNGQKEGEFTVWYRAAAIANPYTRETHYFFYGDDYDTDGSFSAWSTLSLRAHCTELTAGCSVDNDWVTMDVGDWDDGEWVRWDFRSDQNVATQQPEKVLRNKFTASGVALDDFGRPVWLRSDTRPGIRCDSASYFVHEPQSCIFTDVLPRLPYFYGEGYDEVITHIKGAYERPDLTHPPKPGKSMPGRWGYPPDPRALHRVPYRGETWTKNENAKNRACATLPPRQPGQDCDEFPFATTKEGAGFGDGNFSVKYLDSSQNRSAGNDLRDYYRWDRILYEDDPSDGILDEFWVNVP
jgi:hypothetical protein